MALSLGGSRAINVAACAATASSDRWLVLEREGHCGSGVGAAAATGTAGVAMRDPGRDSEDPGDWVLGRKLRGEGAGVPVAIDGTDADGSRAGGGVGSRVVADMGRERPGGGAKGAGRGGTGMSRGRVAGGSDGSSTVGPSRTSIGA